MSAGYFLHSDDPATEDQLGRQDLVSDMARRAATCPAPQVLGLHGDWGSGKTSSLLQLRKELESSFKDSVTVVWFEAWRYQSEAAPIVALLHAMRQRLDWTAKAWAETKKISEVTIRSALLHWDELTRLIGIQAPKIKTEGIQKIGEQWEKDHLAATLPTEAATDILNQTLDSLLGGDNAATNRLVVIIDDLDRCQPEVAFRLLEGIKIYLGLRRCVFILGINQREIERAIEKQIPAADDEDSKRARAKEYLDKLCGHVWRLPYLNKDMLASLAMRLLSDGGIPEATCREVGNLVSQHGCLPPNPRKMKKFANAFISLWYRYDAARNKDAAAYHRVNENEHTLILTLLACLDAFHPEFHRRLQLHEGCFEQIIRWCVCLPAARGDPFSQATDGLQLTHTITEKSTSQLLYDPSAPNVFYAQLLVAKGFQGSTALPADLKPFLNL